MSERYQQFYERWRESSASSEFPTTFPSKLSLGIDSGSLAMDSDSELLLSFRPNSTSGDQILVTNSYNDMFYCLLCLRENDKGPTKGVVLTGQPGVGASL